jgi:hypothetical protein
MNENTTNNKPATSFRSGALQVAVWRSPKGSQTYYSASPTRCFTCDDGKTWQHATDFNQNDIPVIAALLVRSWEWIIADRLRKPAGESPD